MKVELYANRVEFDLHEFRPWVLATLLALVPLLYPRLPWYIRTLTSEAALTEALRTAFARLWPAWRIEPDLPPAPAPTPG